MVTGEFEVDREAIRNEILNDPYTIEALWEEINYSPKPDEYEYYFDELIEQEIERRIDGSKRIRQVYNDS